MARVTFGQPANDVERDAINYLRGHLPDTYEIIHNLEIKQDKEVFEIDLVLSPVRVCSRYQGNSRSHRSLWLEMAS